MSEGGPAYRLHRRRAAVLAAYLAQFERTGNGANVVGPYSEVSAEDVAQRAEDYLVAQRWTDAFSFTDSEIEDLTAARSRYGFSN